MLFCIDGRAKCVRYGSLFSRRIQPVWDSSFAVCFLYSLWLTTGVNRKLSYEIEEI